MPDHNRKPSDEDDLVDQREGEEGGEGEEEEEDKDFEVPIIREKKKLFPEKATWKKSMHEMKPITKPSAPIPISNQSSIPIPNPNAPSSLQVPLYNGIKQTRINSFLSPPSSTSTSSTTTSSSSRSNSEATEGVNISDILGGKRKGKKRKRPNEWPEPGFDGFDDPNCSQLY